ncbi:MAG: branched-chain amino acid aminotransferase [Solirubrobacteraceae bacterium]|nr:branched-chain amino acid aminotransferase [Solirubrobacteraceae bacterium]
MSALLACVDGVVTDPAAAHIPVTDEGLLRGDGVFEVVRLYDGRPFAMEAHLQRMVRSAANLRLEIDLGALQGDVVAILAEAGPVNAALRMLVTRGGRRVVIVETLKDLPETLALALVTYSPTRIMDGIKSLSYGPNMLATRLAQERGCDDALLVTPHGRVLEAPTCSFFYALDEEQLYTPPLEDHILDSITRRHVIAVTGAQERITTSDDLRSIREAFLASTLREVHPVSRIEDRALEAAPGPLSSAAAAAVGDRIRATLEAR